jgi:hypothetical protein
MIRMLTTVGALAITAVMIAGVARANPPYQEMAAPSGRLAQVEGLQPARWHYAWQYHYDKWGQYVPAWVAIPSNLR